MTTQAIKTKKPFRLRIVHAFSCVLNLKLHTKLINLSRKKFFIKRNVRKNKKKD